MNYGSCLILEQRRRKMEAAAVCSSPISLKISKTRSRVTKHYSYTESKAKVDFAQGKCGHVLIGTERRILRKIAAMNMNDVPVVIDSAPVELTWQIVVGAIAGVTPFVVAGIEFSKRIIAQRRCEECRGSGLVLREKGYFRCPQCGGFLPWQSWKRFFSGK